MMSVPDLRGIAVQLQGIIRELCQEGVTADVVESKMEKAMKLLDILPQLDVGRQDDRAVHGILQSSAVGLWNHAVALKTKGAMSNQISAKLRHISCMLETRCNASSQDEQALKKIVMMTLKTTRIWLDCCDAEKANTVLELSSQAVTAIQKSIVTRKNKGEDVDTENVEFEKDYFKMLCYRAEAAVALKDYRSAISYVRTAKELLVAIPKEGTCLSMLCYNFGVEAFQLRQYEESTTWLRESFDLGKDRPGISDQNQGRTLRLLANVYLEWDGEEHLQKALGAITLANSVNDHHAGLFLNLKVMLLCKEPTEKLRTVVEELLKRSDTTLNLCLHLSSLLSQKDRKDLAVEVLDEMKTKFATSSELGAVYTLKLELLLQDRKEEEAKAYVEQIITDNFLEKPLESGIKKRFHLLFWEYAAQLFEEKRYSDSLEWYNYSLSLVSSEPLCDKNFAKLHRNRASCYLHIGELEKAKDAVKEAEKCDKDSAYTQFVVFKVAITAADTDTAKDSLKKMSEKLRENKEDLLTCKDHQSLICLAAQMALESKNQAIAVMALECLTEQESDPGSKLTAIRCLIRLKITDSQDSQSTQSIRMKIIEYLNSAFNILEDLRKQDANAADIQKEAAWFMKIAWNIALQSEDSTENMKDLFKLCQQFTALCPEDHGNLIRQKTCLMMIAASSLQVARHIQDIEEKKEILQEVLLYIGDCKRVNQQIKATQSLSVTPDAKKVTSEILILLYEFEAKTKLGDPDVEAVLEMALALPFSEPKTYETMAALAMESPAVHRKISMRALKAAIRKHLHTDPIDLQKLSRAFHSLIHLALLTGSVSESGSSEEAFTYYTEVLDVLEKKTVDTYPEMEALWLMTKAWNQGIYIYSAGRYKEAEKWCGMSLKFLNHLHSMKMSYEQQMNAIYGEILTQIEQQSNMEE